MEHFMSYNANAGDGVTTGRPRTTMQKVALAMGVVFLLVGILGFIPGVTTQYDTIGVAGHESMAMLLGVFEVSVLHNVVHLLFGVVGLAAARTYPAARAYLLFGGLIYLVLWLYGLVIDRESSANFVPVNSADNWLHFALAVVMVGAALALSRRAPVDDRRSAV
jgi:arginine exporter protein ArgO